MAEPIARIVSVLVLGHTDREHPIEDEIASAAMDAAAKHGFTATVTSGPYYEGGDERDLKLAEMTAELTQLRAIIANQSRPARPGMGHDLECHSLCSSVQWHTNHLGDAWQCARACTCATKTLEKP